MKKRGFSCMYMFADDANTGNRRGYCHFLYCKNFVPLIEFIDCDCGGINYGYMEGASFVMAQDPPRFTGRPTPFSGFECRKSDPTPRRKNIYTSVHQNMYLYELIPYPSDNMSHSCWIGKLSRTRPHRTAIQETESSDISQRLGHKAAGGRCLRRGG